MIFLIRVDYIRSNELAISVTPNDTYHPSSLMNALLLTLLLFLIQSILVYT
jgi:hypothetical protein